MDYESETDTHISVGGDGVGTGTFSVGGAHKSVAERIFGCDEQLQGIRRTLCQKA